MKETQVIEIRTLCQAKVLTLALNRTGEFYNSNSVYIDTDFYIQWLVGGYAAHQLKTKPGNYC